MKLFFWKKGSSSGAEEPSGSDVRHPRLMQGQESYTFRRSRTLTGSLSSGVGSTNAKRPDLKSERIKLHELYRRRRFLRFGLVLVLFCAVLAGLLLKSSVPFAHYRFEAASSLSAPDTRALKEVVSRFLDRYPTQVFVANLDAERLTEFMQTQHPEVLDVHVKSAWLTTSTVTVRFRTPVVTWNIAGNTYYVDESGVAFGKLHGAAPVLRVEDNSGYQPAEGAGGAFASKRLIGYLGQLLGALRSENVGAVERVVVPVSIREFDLYIKGREYPIKVHMDRPPRAQAIDLKNALAFLDGRRITPAYVDVRVEGRAFYK